jgi:arsenite/tail-anchored protein-transporting ATPase
MQKSKPFWIGRAAMNAQARAMLEEDLRSPCTEEIAVFQAFSRVIRESTRHFVIMDTAPTGHTLLLLDATGSYHRDIVRHAATNTQGRMVTPMMRLQDPEQTKVLIVTLPETTPVLEASRLQDDLRRADIEPWAWIINASLAVAESTHPLLKLRAEAERTQIAKVRTEFARRFAVVPMQAEEPVGALRLRNLSSVPSTDKAA